MISLNIENFKCFKKEKVSFEDLTILAGVNSSGKSSVIQVFLLIRDFFVTNENILESIISKKTKPSPMLLNRHHGLQLINSSQILHHDFSDELIKFGLHSTNHGNFKIQLPVSDKKGEGGFAKLDISFNDIQIDKNFIKNNFLIGSNSFYYLCAERYGPRHSQSLSDGSNSDFGYQGEFMAHVMASQHNKKILKNKCFPFSKNSNSNFKKQMNLWLDYIIPNAETSAEVLQSPNLAFMKFANKNYPQYNISPTNTGFGLSYILPILGCCLLAPENSMIIIENPEAHLSPSGQSRLGVFLGCMANSDLKIIIETHSDHIINGIRLAVKRNLIEHKRILFNYFDLHDGNKYPIIKSIKINRNAKLDSWPPGFFDQMDQDLIDINHPSE